MKLKVEEIVQALKELEKPDFNVHIIDNAWYSVRAMTRALTSDKELIEAYPAVQAVRVGLQDGMLELHPLDDGNVKVMCYCCFSGNPEKGIYTLDELKDAISLLKNHYCPPWPG